MKKFWKFVVPWLPVLASVSFAVLQYLTWLLPLVAQQLHLDLFPERESLDFGPLIRNLLVSYVLYWIAVIPNLVKAYRYQTLAISKREKRFVLAHRVVVALVGVCALGTPLFAIGAMGIFLFPFQGWLSVLGFAFSVLIFAVPILDWLVRWELAKEDLK